MDPDLDRFTSRRSTVYANEGIVATSQPLAAEAGRELLRDGATPSTRQSRPQPR